MPVNPTTDKVKNHTGNLIKTLTDINPGHEYELKLITSKKKVPADFNKKIENFPAAAKVMLKMYASCKEYHLLMDGKKVIKVLLPTISISKMDAVFLNDRIVSRFVKKVGLKDIDLFRTNLNPEGENVKQVIKSVKDR